MNIKILLVQIYPTLQRSHMVKAVQKYLNDSVEVVSVADGAYWPRKATLSTVIAHEVRSITPSCVCVYVLASFPGQSGPPPVFDHLQ